MRPEVSANIWSLEKSDNFFQSELLNFVVHTMLGVGRRSMPLHLVYHAEQLFFSTNTLSVCCFLYLYAYCNSYKQIVKRGHRHPKV